MDRRARAARARADRRSRCARWLQQDLRLLPRSHYRPVRSEEHTSELQSQSNLVCRLLLEKKKKDHMLDVRYLPPPSCGPAIPCYPRTTVWASVLCWCVCDPIVAASLSVALVCVVPSLRVC